MKQGIKLIVTIGIFFMAFSISACALFGGDTVQEGETSVSVEDISTGEDSSIEIKPALQMKPKRL